jgi:valacyclovir hydrolase
MSWFEHSGHRIYYEDGGSGDPVLLLPGWGGTIDEFGQLRQALEKNYRVIAADVPGSGKSQPQPRTYTPTYYQDDAPVLLAMLDTLGASPAHLVGFSDGGEYELLMAALKPSAVRSVITWGSAGTLGDNVQLADAMSSVIDDPISADDGVLRLHEDRVWRGECACHDAERGKIVPRDHGRGRRHQPLARGEYRLPGTSDRG